MDTITLKAGENPLLKAIEWAKAAETLRAQGNALLADAYQAHANQLVQFVMRPKQ